MVFVSNHLWREMNPRVTAYFGAFAADIWQKNKENKPNFEEDYSFFTVQL